MQPGPIVPAPSHAMAPGAFSHTRYVIKRPLFGFLDRKFHVYDPQGGLVAFVKHPLLKLRQEFTIFTDETERVPVFVIRARQVIGFNIANDVFDAPSGQKVGTIRHRGLKSVVRDTWDILDQADQPVGLVQEDGASMLRRIFPILPGKWHLELGGATVARLRQIFKFFRKEFELDLSESQGRMDARFAIACSLLALMAEVQREQR